jgi:cardiolipin synthase
MTVDLLWLIGIGATVAEVLGILTALHAVMHARTAQGATAWVISLVTMPFISLPLYWIFGRSKFQGYVKARQSGDARVDEYLEKFSEQFSSPAPFPEGDQSYARVLEHLAKLPFSGFNRTRLHVDGEAAFGAIFRGIEEARDYILVQFFIVKDDVLGQALQEKLIAKARKGVRVFFLYDEIGSHTLPGSYIEPLRTAGVMVTPFKTTKGKRNRFQINFRNHRKIVVVDGRLAYVGGLNVGDEYMGRNPKFGRWRDTLVEVEGPSVKFVQVSFLEDWHWATGDVPQLKWQAEKSEGGSTRVLVLATGPADRLETCGLFFSESINRARERVWITSPYFVPDSQIMTALQLAAMRGVDVRIMLPGKPDHLLVWLSSYSFIKQVEPAGVKFYRYEGGFLHQKVILVDDNISGIGTANLDNRSFRLNFEVTMVVMDRGFASKTAAMLEEDFLQCRKVTVDEYDGRSFPFKLAVQSSRLLAPIQ